MKLKYFKLFFIVTTIFLVVVTVRTVFFNTDSHNHSHDHQDKEHHAEKDQIDQLVEVALSQNELKSFESLPFVYQIDSLIQKGDFKHFKEILSKKKDIKETINDFSKEDGRTLLTRASFGAQLPFVKYLVDELGADVNKPDKDQITPLMEAAASENIAVVKFLLEKKADVNTQNKLGADSLTIALSSGDPELAAILLKNGANANLKWNKKNLSHLMNAARNGHRGIVRVLLSHQARINDQDDQGNTALHYAAAQGFKEVVEDLLRAGAIKEIQNNKKKMPIDLAREEGFSFIEQALK
ncbi:ankyrin repeat domain-containing protein [Halobacteriovorax sp. JY17]|uniref:ankyrin repeat domain-containing protein n=1 Tax=Halobacteriovorax sp. JY17 TaxID=2014617 RepID=UPI000C54A0DC|nr:ankyrin repeat domain-containing protein [Halobacteriovorax sp. JY17]PIK16041.1 MAG: hypothetical protein CES88_04740 [Halobacteriovorax sp. JY17]